MDNFNEHKHMEMPGDGQGMVEYVLILALIALAAWVAMGALGGSISNVFQGISDTFNGAVPGGAS